MIDRIFADQFRAYREAGFEPRPVKPGFKACKEKGWNKPDIDLDSGSYERWATSRINYGIGLRLGTMLADGSTLGALDIDDNRYIRVGQILLNNPPSGRIGQKGIAWFVRIRGELKRSRISFDVTKADGTKIHIGELLGSGGFIVIPPTIHPDTHAAYSWVGKPLLEVGINELPIVEI